MSTIQNGIRRKVGIRRKEQWRANLAARAHQTRLVAKSAVIETGHTIKPPDATLGCKNSKKCPNHERLQELYREVRAHTDNALALCEKQELESLDRKSSIPRYQPINFWQYYWGWEHQAETGGNSDAVNGYIHLADCALVDNISQNRLWGELPRIKSVVDDNLAKGHESRIWFDQFFDDLKCQSKNACHCSTGQGNPTKETAHTGMADRERARVLSALRTAYLQSAVNRNSLQSLQKMMRTISFALFLLLSVLGSIGAIWPDAIRLCAQTCPTGTSPNRWDIFIVEFIGVFSATLAGGLILLSRREADIFRRQYSQILLKAAAGGATAVLGLVLLIPISTNTLTLNTPLKILGFAVAFGFSQEAFTRLVDSRVDGLRKSVTPPSTRTPLELSETRSSSE
jgi:hypothetical protein